MHAFTFFSSARTARTKESRPNDVVARPSCVLWLRAMADRSVRSPAAVTDNSASNLLLVPASIGVPGDLTRSD